MLPSLGSIASRLRLRQLRLLIALDEEGSLHKAAERIAISQPGATKALHEIESTLGATLFLRTHQGLQPNDLGRCVISRTHKLIYNALPKLAYSPVDFSGSTMWKEIQQQGANGKLPAKLARLYFPPERPMFEVYDLREDPFEMNNLAGAKEVAAVERELKAALQEWMILERDFLPLPVPPPAKLKKKAKGM